MSYKNDNFLLRVRKYAGIPENLLSEAFANLLRHIADKEPDKATKIIDLLTDGEIQIPCATWPWVDIATQVTADPNNTPDVEIKGANFVCWIEVKDAGDPEIDQLTRYHELLTVREEKSKALVSLTRSNLLPIELDLLRPAVAWSQVATWLEDSLFNKSTSDIEPVLNHLTKEFLSYLGGIGMTVKKVGFELVTGVEELRNMQTLLREAMELESGVRPHSGGSMGGLIHYVPNSAGTIAFATAIYFDSPDSVGFEARQDFVADTSNLEQEGWELEGTWYKKKLDLSTEEIYFFSRSLVSQTTVIRDFLRECLDQVGHKKGERAVASTE